MNTALWIIAGLLAAVFLIAGLSKLAQPRAKLAASGQGWVEDFSDGRVKLIGALEVLAAIGLILPAVLGVAPFLVPVAASGLALLMLGAAVTHTRRKEATMVVVNIVLLVLAAFVAIGRFGPYSF
jgi:uncharacterized membrane protein YphA (DoxX/SURF4 family)